MEITVHAKHSPQTATGNGQKGTHHPCCTVAGLPVNRFGGSIQDVCELELVVLRLLLAPP